MGMYRVLFPILTLACNVLSAELQPIQIKVGLRILLSCVKLVITTIMAKWSTVMDLILTLYDQLLGLQVLLRQRNSILLKRGCLPTGLLRQWRNNDKYQIYRSVGE